MDLHDFIFFLAWFSGGFVSGLSGMGCAMIAVPILAGFIESKILFPISSIVNLILVIYLASIYKKHCDFSVIKRLFVGIIPGSLVGVALLLYVKGQYIQLLAGIVLIGFVCLQIIRERSVAVVRKETNTKTFLTGFTAGLFNTSISFGNPPVAAYALYLGWKPMQTVGTISIFGLIVSIISCVFLGSAGFYTFEVVKLALLGGAFSLLGMVFATPFMKIIPLNIFKIILLVLIGVGGFSCVWRGLGL